MSLFTQNHLLFCVICNFSYSYLLVEPYFISRKLGPELDLKIQCDQIFKLNKVGQVTSNKSDPSYIHQCCIDVIAGFPINRNEERQASVHREDVHAAVLIVVTREQTYAAVLRTDTRCHYIQSLKKKTRRTVTYTFKTLGCSWSHLGVRLKTNSAHIAGPTTNNANILVNWRSVITYV